MRKKRTFKFFYAKVNMRRNLTTRRVKLKKLRHRLVLILCRLLSACWMQRFLIGCMTILGYWWIQQPTEHPSFKFYKWKFLSRIQTMSFQCCQNFKHEASKNRRSCLDLLIVSSSERFCDEFSYPKELLVYIKPKIRYSYGSY